MSRLNKITTRFGDKGITNLVNRNVSKTDPIIVCIGQIDEANSTIGAQIFAHQHVIPEIMPIIALIQNNLFDLSADMICNTEKINQIHIDRIKQAAEKITANDAHSFQPLADSIAAVSSANEAFEAYCSTSLNPLSWPGKYLNTVSLFLQQLSSHIYHKAPWAHCVSLLIKTVEELAVADLLAGQFMSDIQGVVEIIKADLKLLRSDIAEHTKHINENSVIELEKNIEELNESLPPLDSFVIPEGAAAPMHIVRTTVRKCEIAFLSYSQNTSDQLHLNPTVGKYLNRLSDLIFILCRKINQTASSEENLWKREVK